MILKTRGLVSVNLRDGDNQDEGDEFTICTKSNSSSSATHSQLVRDTLLGIGTSHLIADTIASQSGRAFLPGHSVQRCAPRRLLAAQRAGCTDANSSLVQRAYACGLPVGRYRYAVPILSFEQSTAFSVHEHIQRDARRSVYRSRSRADSEVNVGASLVDARLKAATRRYRNTSRRRNESQSRRASKEPRYSAIRAGPVHCTLIPEGHQPSLTRVRFNGSVRRIFCRSFVDTKNVLRFVEIFPSAR